MRILAAITETEHLRWFHSLMSPAGRRGHELRVLVPKGAPLDLVAPVVAAIEAQEGSSCTDDLLEPARGERLAALRRSSDYAHFAKPGRPSARRGGEPREEVPASVRTAVGAGPARHVLSREGSWRGLRALQGTVSPDAAIREQVAAIDPDVVLACPLGAQSSAAIEYLRAAQALDIPTAGVVPGWDDLYTHGALHFVPDTTLVWNRELAVAAHRLHDMPLSALAVTGAPQLDSFFKGKRRSSREAFCVQMGLDHTRPLLLYAASSPAMAGGDERPLLDAFAGALRARPELSELQVLVRPHPTDSERWQGHRREGVSVWPTPTLEYPDAASQHVLHVQALTHAVAAAGVNTGVFLEAATLDRPLIAVPDADNPDARGGHFRQLREIVEAPEDLDGAAAAVAAALAGEDSRQTARWDFVGHFLRPYGADRSAAAAIFATLDELLAGRQGGPWLPGHRPEVVDPGRTAADKRSARAERAAARQAEAEAAAPNGAGGVAGDEMLHVAETRLRHVVEVTEPLVLISQIQRSGGTLMAHLFDSHPQCHAHPAELHIGWPERKENWPPLDPSSDPAEWFQMLEEDATAVLFQRGYTKYARGKELAYEDEDEYESYPFLLPPSLQREIFDRCVAKREIAAPRDILNAYMTSYFNAWLDNRNLHGDKRWVTGFAARLGIGADNREQFFRDYPDGRLVSCVREPKSWFVSARTYHRGRYGEVERSARLWEWSAKSMLEAKERHPGQVHIVRFEELVKDTPGTMRWLADALGIELTPSLTEPTFNGQPIRANSSFKVEKRGMMTGPESRAKLLEPEAGEYIDSELGRLYERVTAIAGA